MLMKMMHIWNRNWIATRNSFCIYIHSFILDISIAPLQVHYYSEALPTQYGYCVGHQWWNRRSWWNRSWIN